MNGDELIIGVGVEAKIKYPSFSFTLPDLDTWMLKLRIVSKAMFAGSSSIWLDDWNVRTVPGAPATSRHAADVLVSLHAQEYVNPCTWRSGTSWRSTAMARRRADPSDG
jgi:hypothetical protein